MAPMRATVDFLNHKHTCTCTCRARIVSVRPLSLLAVFTAFVRPSRGPFPTHLRSGGSVPAGGGAAVQGAPRPDRLPPRPAGRLHSKAHSEVNTHAREKGGKFSPKLVCFETCSWVAIAIPPIRQCARSTISEVFRMYLMYV